MLVPVYASAQMTLNNLQNCSGGGTVATITATQGDTISFVVTSSLPNLQLIAPESGMALTNGTFTWNTAGFLGPYVALFESSSGTQAQQLVVMIMINTPSSGGSPSSNPTLTVNINPSGAGSVTSITPSGPYTAGTDVTITVSPSANYTFSSWSNVTSSSGTTAHVTMPSSNITVTANFTATGGGGTGPIGSQTNPVVLNNQAETSNGYGYNYYSPSGQYTIPMGQTVYFKIDQIPGKSYTYADVWLYNYDQTAPTMQCGTGNVCSYLLTVNKATGQVTATYQFPRRQGNHGISLTSDIYLLVKITELGLRDTPMSVWWYGY